MPSPRPKRRAEKLRALQRRKMAESAHAYVRGNTRSFYEWLDSSAAILPQGPPIWICGDCHVGNLGPLADRKGRVAVQIRDLDQTVIGNPAHDIVRLGLSLASLARGSDLPGLTTLEILEELLAGYRRGLLRPTSTEDDRTHRSRTIQALLSHSLKRGWRDLAEERIDDTHPSIPLGKRFWALSSEERAALTKLVDTEAVRRLVTRVRHRDDDAPIRMVDAAYWVKGCSSLGRLRYAVLIGVGDKDADGHCLIDIKQAVRAAAPHAPQDMPANQADRVVAGALALSPSLGERMLSARLLGRAVVLRELAPQDLKPDIGQMSRAESVRITGYFASVLGRAHGRQLGERERRAWSRALARYRTRGSAPSWLWDATVELLALHEAAYLDHCRALALQR